MGPAAPGVKSITKSFGVALVTKIERVPTHIRIL